MLFSMAFNLSRRAEQHRRAWQLYDGVTVPRKEDLILVGNPNMRTSKLVYLLADQAEYRMLDISEIPFVTLATTRNIISAPDRMRFGQQSNKFQFTFCAQGTAVVAAPQSQIHAQTPPAIVTPSSILASTLPQPQPRSQLEPEIASPVSACIAAITSYFDFTSQSGRTAQKRSRETAFGGDNQDMESNCRQGRRPCNPYRQWLSTTLLRT